MDYLSVDISPTHENMSIIKIKPENYTKALDWAISKFGNYGEDNWWPAPYLLVDTKDQLAQEYEFVFLSKDNALQFKLMGF